MKGKRLDKLESYIPILELLHLDQQYFEKHWMSEYNIQQSYQDFHRASSLCQGFPTLLIEDGGQIQTLSSGYFDKTSISTFLKTLI